MRLPAVGKIKNILWALFLVTLPVTSFPFFPSQLGGDFIVRPLSLFPLAGLLLLVTLPALFHKPLPRTFQTLMPFLLIAASSSVLSLLSGINPTFAVSVVERLTRGLITLGIGAATYLTVAIIPKTFDELKNSLRWLYAGFSAALLWGTAQAVYVIRFSPEYFQLIDKLQSFISTRRLFENRVSGMTYEPNWFGAQLSFVLIPWLIASVLSDFTVFTWRWKKVTIEWLLLAWSLVILTFTFSRAGLAILLMVLFFSVFVLRFIPARSYSNARSYSSARSYSNARSYSSARSYSNARSYSSASPTRRPKLPLNWLRRLTEASAAIALVAALIFLAGQNNAFFKRLWDFWDNGQTVNLDRYFKYLGFGARFTFGSAAFNVFDAHPILGVGLGNYAFYFEEAMPVVSIVDVPEVLRLVTQNVERYRLMTPKNFYLRILAETGIAGLATFLPFLLALFGSALYLYLSSHRHEQFWGTAGLCLLVAFGMSALSFDSFAIPNMWVVFGLLSAATWAADHNRSQAAPAGAWEESQVESKPAPLKNKNEAI
jgi:hypothetical protein